MFYIIDWLIDILIMIVQSNDDANDIENIDDFSQDVQIRKVQR